MKLLNHRIIVIPLILIFISSYQIVGGQSSSEIIPFERINQITPGVSTYSDVEKLLGTPEKIRTQKKEKVAGVKVGGNKVIEYPSLGIGIIFSGSKTAPDSVVDGIWVETPFSGRSPNDLYIGMPKREATLILARNYHLELNLCDSMFLAKEKGMDDKFQVWFEDDRLIRMKIFR
jgi:hypothetical protein